MQKLMENGALQICIFTITNYRVLSSIRKERVYLLSSYFGLYLCFLFVCFLMTQLFCSCKTCRPFDSRTSHLSLHLTFKSLLLVLSYIELGRVGSRGEVTFIEHFMWLILLNLHNTLRRSYCCSFADETLKAHMEFHYVPYTKRETFSSL